MVADQKKGETTLCSLKNEPAHQYQKHMQPPIPTRTCCHCTTHPFSAYTPSIRATNALPTCVSSKGCIKIFKGGVGHLSVQRVVSKDLKGVWADAGIDAVEYIPDAVIRTHEETIAASIQYMLLQFAPEISGRSHTRCDSGVRYWSTPPDLNSGGRCTDRTHPPAQRSSLQHRQRL